MTQYIRTAVAVAAIVMAVVLSGHAAAADKDGMTIITYNVLEGFRRGESAERAAAWLAKQQPDVVALQELMDVPPEQLRALAREWGHGHAVMHKERGHPVGLTSTAPIEVLERRTEGLHHGYLHAKTHGIHFFVVHLAPGRPRQELRKEEAAILVETMQPLLDAGEPVAVLGDFNDLSPLDPLPNIRGEQQTSWDYGVMQRFLDAGLEDAAHAVASRKGELPTNTCPTRMAEMPIEVSSWRIDYVMLTPDLMKRVSEAITPRIAELDDVSDHYPVIVRLSR